MQQIKTVSGNPDGGGIYLPPDKVGNKPIYPVNTGQPVERNLQAEIGVVQPVPTPTQTPRIADETGYAVTSAPNQQQVQPEQPKAGLLSMAINNATKAVAAPAAAAAPAATPKAAPVVVPTGSAAVTGTFTKDGYTGVQGNTNYSYTPGSDSLVENRIAGLLDPNSALMRKAAAEAAQYAASRGLQSSSIGGEMALSAMVDKALPIASQDAQTFNQAQQLGWQQSWQSGENNLNRTHDASMADKQGLYQTNLQNTQIAAQAAEAQAQRQFQAAQQERAAQLQADRDKMLQDMSNQTMDKQYLQQLELTRVQYEQADKTLMAQLEAGKQADYRNAVSSAYNNYLAQVGAIQADPNMTAEQKAAGANYMQQQLESHRTSLETLYLATGSKGTTSNTTAPTQPAAGPLERPMVTQSQPAGGPQR